MKGFVFWESDHLNEVWDGKVAKWVQCGSDVNIVLNCTDLGEGQLTLALHEAGTQSAFGRFLYYGRSTPTAVSVRGRLTLSPGLIVFEGVWTDPNDGTAEWKFSLEILDREIQGRSDRGTASRSQERKEKAEPPANFTPWFLAEVRPHRVGMYQVRLVAEAVIDPRTKTFAVWSDGRWNVITPNVSRPVSRTWPFQEMSDDELILAWRGLTEQGYFAGVGAEAIQDDQPSEASVG